MGTTEPALIVVLHGHTEGLHHRDRHVEVGAADQRAHHLQVHALIEQRAAQQQPTDELAGRGPIDLHTTATDAAAVRSQRKVSLVGNQMGAQRAEGLNLIGHRSISKLLMAIEHSPVRRHRNQRGEKPTRGATLAGIDVQRFGGQHAAKPLDAHGACVAIHLQRRAHLLECRQHRLGVVGEKHAGQFGSARRQARTEQCPVGQALRPRQRNGGVGRLGQAA